MKYTKERSSSCINSRGYFNGTDEPGITEENSYDCAIDDSAIRFMKTYTIEERIRENRKRKLRDNWKYSFSEENRIRPWNGGEW